MTYKYSYRKCGVCGRLFVAAVMICLLAVIRAFAAGGEAEVLGVAGDLVPDSICVGPDGKRFVAVVVDPATNKRRVIVNCKNVGKDYDLVAQGTPIFSPDGGRIAFVAARGGKCYVVVDGMEGSGYEIIKDRWPIADLVLSRGGKHVAYKTRKDGKNHLVVDGQEFGPYDDHVAADKEEKARGIWDFQFTDDEKHFFYRAKTGGGMVACRGWFQKDAITLTTSKEYENIGAGTPVWLRGTGGDQPDGELFVFVARADGKDFISLLPEPKTPPPVKPAMYAEIIPNSLSCAPNRQVGFTARDQANKWRAVIFGAPNIPAQGQNEWKPCDALGPLMYTPIGNRWACMAKVFTNIVMLIDGQEGPACAEIVYPGTVFAAGDNRVVYVAVKDGQARLVVDAEEEDIYRVVDCASILFAPGGRRRAYVAGDGQKKFVVLDGGQQPAFDQVWGLRFSPSGESFAYCARNGEKNHLVIDGKTLGPYAGIGTAVFSADGLTVAWAALGDDASWRIYVNGEAGPAFESIVSQLTFAPGVEGPVYVARMLAGGEYAFAMVSDAGTGRKYPAIWTGDDGKLFPRDGGLVDYFGIDGQVIYRETAGVTGAQVLLSDIKFEKASVGWQDGRVLSIGGIRYPKGVGVCAPSEIIYDLKDIRKKAGGDVPLRFTAVVGVDDQRKDLAMVRCSVFAGDVKLASTPLLRRDRSQRLDVAIPKDSVNLRLVTETLGEKKENDLCNWAGAAVATGKVRAAHWPTAQVDLPARWASLQGDGLRYDANMINGWKEGAQAGWDFICPEDGTYELFVTYGCHKDGEGSEFVVDVGKQPLSMKTVDTGDWGRFKRLSVGRISLKNGTLCDISIKLTKGPPAINIRSIELVRKD